MAMESWNQYERLRMDIDMPPLGNQNGQSFRVTVKAKIQYPGWERLDIHGRGPTVLVIFNRWFDGHAAIQPTHAGQFDAPMAGSHHN